jgi:type II secretory pathway pseudopilin PulG
LKLKNRNRLGFSLVEVLLALGLSSFIMLALMQSYQMLVKYIESARSMAHMTQRIALVTHLIEQDLAVACMPQFFPTIESNKEKGVDGSGNEEKDKAVEEKQKKQLSDEEKKKKEEKKLEERKKSFFTEIDDGDFHKIKDKKVELLKSCNFITTHALEVYSESSPRWVRVRYELIKDKKSKQEMYTLVRKQTTDIYNTKMKISEVDPNANSKEHPLVQHEVMRGIKGLFIEFSMIKMPEKKEGQPQESSFKKEEPEEVRAFAWGESKKTAGEMPQRAHVYIDLWDDELRNNQVIELDITICADGYPEKIMKQALERHANGEHSGGALAGFGKGPGSKPGLASDAVKGNPGSGNNSSGGSGGGDNNFGGSGSGQGGGGKPRAPQGAPGAGMANDMIDLLSGALNDE